MQIKPNIKHFGSNLSADDEYITDAHLLFISKFVKKWKDKLANRSLKKDEWRPRASTEKIKAAIPDSACLGTYKPIKKTDTDSTPIDVKTVTGNIYTTCGRVFFDGPAGLFALDAGKLKLMQHVLDDFELRGHPVNPREPIVAFNTDNEMIGLIMPLTGAT